jgi:hypothetical protein
MTTVAEMAAMVGIDERNMKLFLDLYAIEMRAGSTLEAAIANVHKLFSNLAAEIEKPEAQQADWFKALKASMAADVYYTIRNQDAQRKIFEVN